MLLASASKEGKPRWEVREKKQHHLVKGVPNHAAMEEIQRERQNPFFFGFFFFLQSIYYTEWGGVGGMSAPAMCESKQGLYHYDFYLEKIQGSHIKASFLFLLLPMLAHICMYRLKSFWPPPCLHQSRSNLAASSTMCNMVWGIWRCGWHECLVRTNLSFLGLGCDVATSLENMHNLPTFTWGTPKHEKKRYMAKVTRKNCKKPREAGTRNLLEITGWWPLSLS